MQDLIITAKPFLDDFDSIRKQLDELEYTSTESTVDGVTYPTIAELPSLLCGEIYFKLSQILGYGILPHPAFARLSLKDTPVPHQAHTDAVMGDYSFMLYVNREEHCEGGTGLIKHVETGLSEQPTTEEEFQQLEQDMNKTEKWFTYNLCKMEPNKGFIFPAKLMHRAEPIGGFGDNPTNGRLVITCFFNLGDAL